MAQNDRPRLSRTGRWVATVLGYGFLLLGVLGLVLPVLQGVLFLVVGLLLLSRSTPWAERALDRLRRRHPGVGRAADALARRLDLWIYRFEVAFRRFFRRLRAMASR